MTEREECNETPADLVACDGCKVFARFDNFDTCENYRVFVWDAFCNFAAAKESGTLVCKRKGAADPDVPTYCTRKGR
jgi:hypothetical protein